MEATVIKQLLNINHQFYQTFAASFAATRQRLQPGVRKLLTQLDPSANVLDLGCGSGEVWRYLSERSHQGRYIGADFSLGLLEVAKSVQLSPQASFVQLDLAESSWPDRLPRININVVLAFAVFHHLPGQDLRLNTLQTIHRLLEQGSLEENPAGQLLLSVWQVENWPKFPLRQQPWETIGLDREQVEPGDYLIDWRLGGLGLRYVHRFTLDELTALASATGFKIQHSFLSDGKAGNLGLYQVWELV